jgi:signal transduction histidine kinase
MGLKDSTELNNKVKSVKSLNQCESPDCFGAGVIQTINDIVKAHDGEIQVETKEGEGTNFIVLLNTTL